MVAEPRIRRVLSARAIPVLVGAAVATLLLLKLVPDARTGQQSGPPLPEPPAAIPAQMPVIAAADVGDPAIRAAALEHEAPVEARESASPAPPARMVIGNSPPTSVPANRGTDARFAAEALDPDWRQKMFEGISSRLTMIEEGLESAQIDCRSATCRVELVARDAREPREWGEWLKPFFKDVTQLGFNNVDTEFVPGGRATLSYLTTRLPGAPAFSPDVPPEIAQSLQQSIRDSAQAFADGDGLSSEPITVIGVPPVPAGR